MGARRDGRVSVMGEGELRAPLDMYSRGRHSVDVHKRMDDIYSEMEQNWKEGRFRLPLKFIGFHKTEIMFQFVSAANAYALAFVKIKTLEKSFTEENPEELKMLHARDEWCRRMHKAIRYQNESATEMASSYARLVLHCSNFENHKEDEHFFECVYFFVCSVVKLGIAPDHWRTTEVELGFLFRGSQFSSNIKGHTTGLTSMATTKDGTSNAATSSASASGAASAEPGSAAKKIQGLSSSGSSSNSKDASRSSLEGSRFLLPKSRISSFPESVPVKKIVSDFDATKTRAVHNIEISQAIREKLNAQRAEDHRRQLAAIVIPRQSVGLEMHGGDMSVTCGSSAGSKSSFKTGSPRISMRSTFTTRSPALNHLLPTTEDRVRVVLKDYEQNLKLRLVAQSPRLS